MREAVKLHRAAERWLKALGKDGQPTRLVLSLCFKALLGIQRVFHFETLSDVGFAILSGGRRVLTRTTLGSLVRRAPVRGVLHFVHATEPKVKRASEHHVSVDEHAVPRFTRKFNIRKGFHTIRNKHMKIEKLFCSFNLDTGMVLSMIVTRGHEKLSRLTRHLLKRLRPRAGSAEVRVVLDAGAAENHERLLELVGQSGAQTTIVRVPRRPPYRKAWAKIPKSAWTSTEEPGAYKTAPPKQIAIAETTMRVKEQAVRTIVVREKARKANAKDRWHALWVFGDNDSAPYDLVKEFRRRQDHEQTYRIMLHDAYVDTAPSGYNKRSKNPKRPGFRQNALTLYAWIAALATNALRTFTRELPGQESLPRGFKHAHVRTVRRWLFNVPAELYFGDDTLIVVLNPRKLRPLWTRLVERSNKKPVRIPWLENRRLILALEQPGKR